MEAMLPAPSVHRTLVPRPSCSRRRRHPQLLQRRQLQPRLPRMLRVLRKRWHHGQQSVKVWKTWKTTTRRRLRLKSTDSMGLVG